MCKNCICIIPARGGSKRIPRKNIRDFCGKPMIAWSIEAALVSELFERVVVSTDDEEIADVSKKHGAEVPFVRPAELSDDFAGTDAVFLHALKELNVGSGYACCLYATAPFVAGEDLKRGYNTILEAKATSAFSVTTFEYPIFRALQLNEKQRLEMIWPENHHVRSQDLPEAYHDAGQFYWVNVQHYLKEQKIFSSDAVPVHLPRCQVQDVDTEEDWIRAEMMMQILQKNAKFTKPEAWFTKPKAWGAKCL